MTTLVPRRTVAVAPLAALAVLAGVASGQSVITVDDSGGADFFNIQPAIDAAAAGDVVLVKDGTYAEFTISGKGVAVLADAGATVQVNGTDGDNATVVTGVPSGQVAMIRGITFVPPGDIQEEHLLLQNNQGVVWLEDLLLQGGITFPFIYFLNTNTSLDVETSDQVVIVNSVIRGSGGAVQGSGLEAGSIAMEVDDSTVHAYGSDFAPGGTLVAGGPGRPAIDAGTCELVLRDCIVQGGYGGAEGVFGQPGPGNGGPGMRLESGAEAWTINTSVMGGPGQTSMWGAPSSQPGPPFLLLGGTISEHVADQALLSSSTVVRDDVLNEDAVFDVTSTPNGTVYLLVSFVPIPGFVSSFPELTGVGLNPVITPVGFTDGAGQFQLTVGIPSLPPGQETWSATVQFLVFSPGDFEVTNPTIVTVIDESF